MSNRERIPPLHESMKSIAFNLVNSMHICDIKYGTVVGVNPLRIKIDEQEPLREESLVLTNMVRDHYVDIEVSLKTNNDNYMIPDHTHTGNMGNPTDTGNLDTTHLHDVQGRKKIMMYYGLKLNEKVILLRKQGAKNYLVVDRIDTPIVEGEWI